MKNTIQNPLMQRNLAKRDTISHLMGHNRQHCIETLVSKGVDSISFAHWLAIPSQQLLLVFRHQRCVAIEFVAINANQVAA